MNILFVAAIIVFGVLMGLSFNNLNYCYRNGRNRKYQIVIEILLILSFGFVAFTLGYIHTYGG